MSGAEGAILPRRIYMLPVGFKWSHHPSITLIGDAAHVMSPFAGEGVNLALFDAYNLAQAIVAHEDASKAIEAYEEKMFVYAAEAAHMSNANLELCFSKDAAPKLETLMNELHEEFQ